MLSHRTGTVTLEVADTLLAWLARRHTRTGRVATEDLPGPPRPPASGSHRSESITDEAMLRLAKGMIPAGIEPTIFW